MWIDEVFPSLAEEGYEVTSQDDNQYNCIAYAAGETDRWWSHIETAGYYWPEYASRTALIQSLVEVFTGLGYKPCPDASSDPDLQKIALYSKNGEWTHAAIQLPDGSWSSKLGAGEDIRHKTPQSLTGTTYGEVYFIMGRQRRNDLDHD